MSESEAQRKNLTESLRARERELRARIRDALVDAERNLQAPRGRVHDAGDESVADLLADLRVIGLEQEAKELEDIQAAFARVAQGVYGVCIDCGESIARERLNAHPTAKRCAACQTRHEHRATDRTPSL